MSIFIESIKRLYQDNKVSEETVIKLFDDGRITEEERDYIFNARKGS